MELKLKITDEDLVKVLKVYVETCPYIDIVEDIQYFLVGYTDKLSDKVIALLNREEMQIMNYLNIMREMEVEA